MDGDEVLREVGERADRDGPAAQPRARAALGGDRPRDDELAVLDGAADVLHLLGDAALGLDDQRALDRGALGARTDTRGVGPAAEQQAEPGHDHRLARARLARDDGETR